MALSLFPAAIIVAFGGLAVYFLSWRSGKLERRGWGLCLEMVGFVGIGVIFVTQVLQPDTALQAFFLGAGWDTILSVGKIATGREYTNWIKKDVQPEQR